MRRGRTPSTRPASVNPAIAGGVKRRRAYSDTTLSAAAVFSANTLGLMNWPFLVLRSASVTPRATEHLPQTKIGTR